MRKKLIIFAATVSTVMGSSVGVLAETPSIENPTQVTSEVTFKASDEPTDASSETEGTTDALESDNSADSGQSNLETEQEDGLTLYIDEEGNKYLLYPDGTHYTGWYDMPSYGKLYFDPSNPEYPGAASVSKVYTIDGETYLFDENGYVVDTPGTPVVNGRKYWIKTDGSLGTGWLYLGDWKMFFDYESYAALTDSNGIVDFEGKKYLFNKDGVMQNYAGTTVINGAKYWFSTDDASLKSGWLTLGDWKLYFDPETYQCAIGITQIDGKNYIFDSNGILQTTGIATITYSYGGKSLYYVGEDNTLQSGWIEIGNKKIYCEPSSFQVAVGYRKIDGKDLIFDENGYLIEKSGTFTVNNNKFAIDENGNVITGWIKLGNWKMYFDPYMRFAAVGKRKIDGKFYLFNDDGVMQDYPGTTIVNGKKYWFSTDDASLKSGWLDLGIAKLYFDPLTYEAYTSTTKTIDGVTYNFDSNGCATEAN